MIKIVSLLAAASLLAVLQGCTIHHSIGDNFGSFVSGPDGQAFKPVGPRWDYQNTALLYVYRPATEWSMDELETPSFNVDGERLFNLKGGAYTWYELEPGRYSVVMRRGLLGLEGIGDLVIKTLSRLELEAQPGKVYYLRYSEIDPPKIIPDQDVNPLGDGPLQMVSPTLALSELPVTKMLHRGRDRLQPEQPAEAIVVPSPTQPGSAPDGLPASDGAGSKTKEQDWWPF